VCRYYAESADKVYGSAPGSDQGTLAYTLREPYGVVAAIAPWNFPLCNAVIKTVPALAMGNCVVLKPSELSPGSALRLAELALEAGVPPGVFNVIPGLGGDAGAALVSHGDVDLVTFTGSTATGQRIMQLAPAQRPKPVMLECGGKSPQIVFADAPTPDLSAPTIAAEAFANQGQVCVARSRLLVHVSRKDALIAELERVVADYVIGDPLDAATTFGPLASQQQRDRVVGMMDQAIRDGARPLLGGRDDDGCFVRPAIFDQVTPEMEAVRQEIFGPVLTVQTFETPEQALEMANATPYGLGATVWTRDYPTAHMMIRGLRAGHVTICATATAFEGPGFALASEPRGASGFGPETGLDGLRSYTALKSVVLQAG
jgi:acyl-CoA reductase-like NAD-dependent aldehyde dehydrogenase